MKPEDMPDHWLAELKRDFLKKVQRTATCWLWTGKVNAKGYGYFHFGKGHQLAHRASYLLFGKGSPTGLNVLHTCDNPPCVNPDHLFLGTQRDNIADCTAKGRFSPPPVLATLTEADVRWIRSSAATAREVTDKYGISREQVRRIRNYTSWASLT